MENKSLLRLLATLLVFGVLTASFNVKSVVAAGTIYIRLDGTVDPTTAPIQRFGDLYTFTADIYDVIVVQRDNAIIDGNGYKLQGAGVGTGFDLWGRMNVTVRNTYITGFQRGVYLHDNYSFDIIIDNTIVDNVLAVVLEGLGGSSAVVSNVIANNSDYGINLHDAYGVDIEGNIILNNGGGIHGIFADGNFFGNLIANNRGPALAFQALSANVIGNTITDNNGGIGGWEGFDLHNSNIKGNVITNNGYGIDVQMPTYTIIDSNLIAGHEVGISLWGVTVYSNNITNNDIAGNSVGFQIDGQGGNVIYQNNFINNPTQAYDPNVPYEVQVWDNGYPSGGNYWSDYTGVDNYSGPYQNETGGDGIGDIPYTINSWDVWINKDNYPRMLPLNASKYALTITATKGGTTNPQQGAHIYYPGQGTIITAFPQTDYLFDHWELDNINIGSTNPILIVIDTNHALHTVFRPKPDIAVTGLLAYPDNVRRGQPVYIDVAVENQWYSKETFDILVYADKDKSVIGDEIIVGTQTVYRLVPGTSKTVNFIWDISTTPLGTGYYISAKATVPQDRDLSDNSLTAKKKIIIRR